MPSPKLKSQNLIATFDYLRKSTKGDLTDAAGAKRERQEKSISQQRKELDGLSFPQEIEAAGFTGFSVMGTFADEGISGWKHKRPGFNEMIKAIKAHEATHKVIRVDNMDRFSRADIDETAEIFRYLKKAGVKWIVSAAQGVYKIDHGGNDLIEHMKIALVAFASHEYSKQLSRRVTLAKRNSGAAGKRSGGKAPFGFVGDGKGGLVPGKPEHVKLVRQIFNWYVKDKLSLCEIVNRLNTSGVPSPAGKKWHSMNVGQMLTRPVYCGDFIFNHTRGGRFHGIDGDGKVVETGQLIGPGKVYIKKDVFEPLVTREMFDAAQRRKSARVKDRTRRKGMYTLAGILKCDHCGQTMYGCLPNGPISVTYKCQSSSWHGKNACRPYSIREDRILPFIIRMLGDEIEDLTKVLTARPPQDAIDGTIRPNHERDKKRAALVKEREVIAGRISNGIKMLLDITDVRTRKEVEAKITEMQDELAGIDAEISVDMAEHVSDGYNQEAVAALREWWEGFDSRAVSLPVPGRKLPKVAAFYVDHFSDETSLLVEPRVINDALHELGAEVRLRWKSEKYRSKGNKRKFLNRYTLDRGRFQLGKRSGELPKSYLRAFADV